MTLHTPHLLGPGEGDHWAFLNTTMSVKAGGPETAGTMTVIEALMPPGFAPPPHRHDLEDEVFYVVEGEITMHCDGAEATYGPGGFAFLPRGLPHHFVVSDDGPAKMLQITAPAQFEEFVAEVGERIDAAELPEPTEPDVEALLRASERFRIEILAGPPDA